jgi:hypothetical protein
LRDLSEGSSCSQSHSVAAHVDLGEDVYDDGKWGVGDLPAVQGSVLGLHVVDKARIARYWRIRRSEWTRVWARFEAALDYPRIPGGSSGLILVLRELELVVEQDAAGVLTGGSLGCRGALVHQAVEGRRRYAIRQRPSELNQGDRAGLSRCGRSAGLRCGQR